MAKAGFNAETLLTTPIIFLSEGREFDCTLQSPSHYIPGSVVELVSSNSYKLCDTAANTAGVVAEDFDCTSENLTGYIVVDCDVNIAGLTTNGISSPDMKGYWYKGGINVKEVS